MQCCLHNILRRRHPRRYGLVAHPIFSHEAVRMINSYTWPGNVRELRHQVSRAMLLCHESQITETDLALPVHRVISLNIDKSVTSTGCR